MNGRLLGALLVAAVAILTMLACNRSHSPATAEPVAKAQQWEYKIIELPRLGKGRPPTEKLQEEFNKLGADGWELSVVSLGEVGIFKRPKR